MVDIKENGSELESLVLEATLEWSKKLTNEVKEQEKLLLIVSGCEIQLVDREYSFVEVNNINKNREELLIPIHLESFRKKTLDDRINYLKSYFLEATTRLFIKSQEVKKNR